MLGAAHRGGIVGGYWLSALCRAVVTIAVVTLVALVVGLEVRGNGIDLLGLYTLALLMNAFAALFGTGVAMRLDDAGRPRDPGAGVPAALPRAGVGALDLLTGWVQTRRPSTR